MVRLVDSTIARLIATHSSGVGIGCVAELCNCTIHNRVARRIITSARIRVITIASIIITRAISLAIIIIMIRTGSSISSNTSISLISIRRSVVSLIHVVSIIYSVGNALGVMIIIIMSSINNDCCCYSWSCYH